MKRLTVIVFALVALSACFTSIKAEQLRCLMCYECDDDSDDEPESIECPSNGNCVKVVEENTKKIYRDCGKRHMMSLNGLCNETILFRDRKVKGCLYVCNDEHDCNDATSSYLTSGQWKTMAASLGLLLFSFPLYG